LSAASFFFSVWSQTLSKDPMHQVMLGIGFLERGQNYLVGGGSRHDRKHVGDFGHQQQGQRTQAFAPGPHVGAATWLPEIDCQAITLHYT